MYTNADGNNKNNRQWKGRLATTLSPLCVSEHTIKQVVLEQQQQHQET